MQQLRVTVDIGVFETGLNVGDAIEAIHKALEPIKQQAWSTDDFDTLPKYGTIVGRDDELLGEWEIGPRKK